MCSFGKAIAAASQAGKFKLDRWAYGPFAYRPSYRTIAEGLYSMSFSHDFLSKSELKALRAITFGRLPRSMPRLNRLASKLIDVYHNTVEEDPELEKDLRPLLVLIAWLYPYIDSEVAEKIGWRLVLEAL